MQNIFQDYQLKLYFANPINPKMTQSKLLKFLLKMENYKKVQNMQTKFFGKKIDLLGFAK